MDTDSLHLAPTEKRSEDCLRSEMEATSERPWPKDCNDSFIADSVDSFSLAIVL